MTSGPSRPVFHTCGPLLPVVGLILAGCLSAGSLFNYRGAGVSRCYKVSYEILWPTVEESVRWAGLVIENASEENGFIIARSYQPEVEDPADMALDADQGEAVAVFFEPDGATVWAVEVVSRPRFSLDPSPRDWTRPVFAAIEDRLPPEARAPDDELATCTRARGLPSPGPSTSRRTP